jgi:outer membrane protein TolC
MRTRENPPGRSPRTSLRRLLAGAALAVALLPAAGSAQAAARSLTLEEAIELALRDNAGLAALRERVVEMERSSSAVFTNYLPRVRTQPIYLASDNSRGILLPAGSLGYFPELGGRFPRTDRTIEQGGQDLFVAMTTVAQPITHYFKIREGRGVVLADEVAARAAVRRAELDVTLKVTQAYAGLLIAQEGVEVARARVATTEQRTVYAAASVASGSAVDVAAQEARVRALQARQDLLEREGEVDDLNYLLADAIGLPGGTRLELSPPALPAPRDATPEAYVRAALEGNPELTEARALVTKATHGVSAARAQYIPDVAILGVHLYQNSLPFFPENTLMFGIQGSFTLFDFGERRQVVGQRRAQLAQAENNLRMIEGRIRGEVEAAHRKLARSRELVALAEEALSLRQEASRLMTQQTSAGFVLAAEQQQASADRMEAEQNLLRARLGYRIAAAELDKVTGGATP